jgi:hypothetical protein
LDTARVAVPRFLLVVDDLLHGDARLDSQGFELDLYEGQAVYENDQVVALARVLCVDAELVHHFVAVLAPVLEVDQGVLEGRPVLSLEIVDLPQALGRGEDVAFNNAGEEPLELGVGEADPVELLELLPEVALQGLAVPDIWTIGVFQVVSELSDKALFDLGFFCHAASSTMRVRFGAPVAAPNRLHHPAKKLCCQGSKRRDRACALRAESGVNGDSAIHDEAADGVQFHLFTLCDLCVSSSINAPSGTSRLSLARDSAS